MKYLSVFLLFLLPATTWSKKLEPLGLEPGLYSSVSKVYLNGKLNDPFLNAKKQTLAMANGKQKTEAAQNIRQYQNTQICITKDMLQPQNFYQKQQDSKYCKYTLTRATAQQITAHFDCGEVRGKGIVTTKMLTPTTYESAFIGGKGPKGEKLKVVSTAKKIGDKCSPQINTYSGQVFTPNAPSKPKAKKK